MINKQHPAINEQINNMKKIILTALAATSLISCTNNKNAYDASGTFEANETIVAAEANGVIKLFKIEEGQILQAGQHIGYIDSIQPWLRKKQLEAQIKSVLSKSPDIAAQTSTFNKQVGVIKSQLNTQLHEKQRIENLVKADAATPKQLDDINGQVDALQKQLEVIHSEQIAQTSQLTTQTNGLTGDIIPLKAQIDQVNDQLSKCVIINNVNGTVLAKYAEANEMASNGKPLYKIADLSTLILRAYISGNQLSAVKINQPVKVLVDDADKRYKEYAGTIEWISDKAEFTPKTIQTKDERANLVYALKIRVKNDGYLKIGMYADVKL
jgi:HlyD family secretion protein